MGAVLLRDGTLEWEATDALFVEDVQWTEAAILELGALAFRRWPAQPLPTLELELEFSNQDAESVIATRGLWLDAEGAVGGLIAVDYDTGPTVLAATCATCHARVNPAGRIVDGPASSLQLSDAIDGWPVGTVDATADAVDNPVAMPDLRATLHQNRLHWTGNLENGLLALAVRIDTLLITNASGLARPPRQVAFALAYNIESLGEGRSAPRDDGTGARVFEDECRRCHEGIDGSGTWVSVDAVGTDARVAESPERGTGGYRVPSLFRVRERSRLTHRGWDLTLSAFLSEERLERYPGHPFGFDLDAEERAALVQYLRGILAAFGPCVRSPNEYICKYTHADERPHPQTLARSRRQARQSHESEPEQADRSSARTRAHGRRRLAAGVFRGAREGRCRTRRRRGRDVESDHIRSHVEGRTKAMKFLLDTNTVSALMRADAVPLRRLAETNRRDVLLAQPVLAEIAHGIERLPRSKRSALLEDRLALIAATLGRAEWTDAVSAAFGEIKALREQKGRPIEDFDAAIAAHAVATGATLVTSKVKHMAGVPNLLLENWLARA